MGSDTSSSSREMRLAISTTVTSLPNRRYIQVPFSLADKQYEQLGGSTLNDERQSNQPEVFDHAWPVVAAAGYCECAHGAQYYAVRVAWLRANRPDDISRFISHHVPD